MDFGRNTQTKYLNGSPVDNFINNRSIKSLYEFTEHIYQVKMIKKFLFYPPARQIYKVAFALQFSSPLSAIQTDMSWLKRILIVFTWQLVRKNLTKSVDQKGHYFDTRWCKAIAVII